MKGPWIARLSPALIALLVGFAAFGGPQSGETRATVTGARQAASTISTGTPAIADDYTPFASDGADVDDDFSDAIVGELTDAPRTQLTVNHLFENHEWPCTPTHWPTLSARGPPAV